MKKSNTNLLAIFFLISLLVSCKSTLQNRYQGESNVDNYQEYQELFNGMIEDWIANWNLISYLAANLVTVTNRLMTLRSDVLATS